MIITLTENTRTAANATIKRATAAAHKSMEQLDAQTAAELEKIYRQAAAAIGACPPAEIRNCPSWALPGEVKCTTKMAGQLRTATK
jgi:hypothetical protein